MSSPSSLFSSPCARLALPLLLLLLLLSCALATATPVPVSSGPRDCASSHVDLSPLRSLNDVYLHVDGATVWFHPCGAVEYCDCPVDSLLCLTNRSSSRVASLVDYQPGSTTFTLWETPGSNSSGVGGVSAAYNVSDGQACANDASRNRTVTAYFVCAAQSCTAENVTRVLLDEQSCQHQLWIDSPYACANQSGAAESAQLLPPPPPSASDLSAYASSQSSSTGSSLPTPPYNSSRSCVNASSGIDLRPLALLPPIVRPYLDSLLVFQPCGGVHNWNGGLNNGSLVLYNLTTQAYSTLLNYSPDIPLQLSTYVVPFRGWQAQYVYPSADNALLSVWVQCDASAVEGYASIGGSTNQAGSLVPPFYVYINSSLACPGGAQPPSNQSVSSSTGMAPPQNYSASSSSTGGSVASSGCVNSEVDLRPLLRAGPVSYASKPGQLIVFQPCGELRYADVSAASLVAFNISTGETTVLVGLSNATQQQDAYNISTSAAPYFLTRYTYNDSAGRLLYASFLCDPASVATVLSYVGSGGGPYYLLLNSSYACVSSPPAGPSSSTAAPPQPSTGTSSSTGGALPAASCVNASSGIDLRPLALLPPIVRPYLDSLLVFQPCGGVHNWNGGLNNGSLVLYNLTTQAYSTLLNYSPDIPLQLSTYVVPFRGWQAQYVYPSADNALLSVWVQCDASAVEGYASIGGSTNQAGSLVPPFYVYINSSLACPGGAQPPSNQSVSSSTGMAPPQNYSASSSSTGSAHWLLNVDGHVFSEAELAVYVILGALLLALLSACCYLVRRRRKPSAAPSDVSALLDAEEGSGVEGVVVLRLPNSRRRPPVGSSASDTSDSGQKPSASRMSQSAAGSYGLL